MNNIHIMFLKKSILVILMGVLLSGLVACNKKIEGVITSGDDIIETTVAHDQLPKSTSTKFSYEDLASGGVSYKMTEEQVVSILGQPEQITEPRYGNLDIEDVIHRTKIYDYNNALLVFTELDGKFILTSMSSESSEIEFSRGLKVGMGFEEVLNAYYRDENCLNNDYLSDDKSIVFGKMLYGNYTLYNLENTKITDNLEYGMIAFDGDGSLDDALQSKMYIQYTCMEPPYMAGYASVDDEFAHIEFEMGKGKITKITWYFYHENKVN